MCRAQANSTQTHLDGTHWGSRPRPLRRAPNCRPHGRRTQTSAPGDLRAEPGTGRGMHGKMLARHAGSYTELGTRGNRPPEKPFVASMWRSHIALRNRNATPAYGQAYPGLRRGAIGAAPGTPWVWSWQDHWGTAERRLRLQLDSRPKCLHPLKTERRQRLLPSLTCSLSIAAPATFG